MSAWNIEPVPIPGKDVVQSSLHPRKDRFPLHIPYKMHTHDKKEVAPTPDVLLRLRSNDEDRIKEGNISLLTRLIQHDLPPSDSIAKGCDADHSTSKLSALVHQDFIRRYLTMDTPERGLLVYHGLGSGKTATSIAVIEANKSKKRIIVMVPASLQDNYELEIAKLGPVLFGRGAASLAPYTWYFHRIDPENYDEIARDTGIPIDMIERNGGVFRVILDSDREEGYTWDEMPESTRTRLGDQIVQMLLSQIEFVRYNGLSYRAAYSLDLDNAIVVVDEVHNISRMVRNKTEGIGKILYNKIRDAKNSKIVALSGTPLVNTPFEVAILSNMIHGVSRMTRVPFTHSRTGESGSDLSIIKEMYLDPIVRYVTIVPSEKAGGGSEMLLLRHANGFESLYSGGEYVGILRTDRELTLEREWLSALSDRMKGKGIVLDHSHASTVEKLWFPETEDTFMKMYTNSFEAGTSGYIKNEEQLLRRLMLVSYYRGADPIKYPRTRDIQVVRTEMSNPQFEEYARARSEEVRMSSRQQTSKNSGGGKEEDVFTGRYRTRQLCSAYFPDGRPTRDIVKKELEMRGIVGDNAIQEEYNRRLTIAMENIRAIPDLRSKIGLYSPKYKKVLNILGETEGLVLIYSSFLRMEGLETMGVFLESDGYVPFEIVMDADGKSPRIKGVMNEDERDRFLGSTGKRFMVFSGGVDKDIRAYLIRIFRGDFSGLPESLLGDLRSIMGDSYTEDSTANLRGSVCRILMITGAGAEGLNLKAVRQVHVLEPYWNQARLDQVFGRAVRVCSHAELGESERDVERYLHICGFPRSLYQEMISRGDNRFLEAKDGGESTDEYLAALSKKKSTLNTAFLNLMKRAAVDCALHAEQNGLSLTECMSMPAMIGKNANTRVGISPDHQDDADSNEFREELRDTIIVQIGRSIIRDTKSGDEIEVGTRVVAVDYRTMNAYDPDMIVIRKLKRVGHVEITEDSLVTLVLEQDPSVTRTSRLRMSAGGGGSGGGGDDDRDDDSPPTPDYPQGARERESGNGEAGTEGGGTEGGGTEGGGTEGGGTEGGTGSDRGGLGDEYGKMVGGVPPGVRFQIASDDMLGGDYVDFLGDLPEEARNDEISRLVREYGTELISLMLPTSDVLAKVFILVIGHPGSGKTRFTQEMLDRIIRVKDPNKTYPFITRDDGGNVISIPIVKDDSEIKTLGYDDYARIGVDEILVYMREYQERLIVRDEGAIRYIDPRVIGDRTLRDIANQISMRLFETALDVGCPIIYETTFANPKNVVNTIVKVAMNEGYVSQIHEGEGRPVGASVASRGGGGVPAPEGSLIVNRDGGIKTTEKGEVIYPYGGQMIVMNFYNTNVSLTKTRVKKRFEREGRYLRVDGRGFSVDAMWREHKTKRERGEYKSIAEGKGRSKYKFDIPADLYIEIDTTDPDNAKIDYDHASIGIGLIRGPSMGELSTEMITEHS